MPDTSVKQSYVHAFWSCLVSCSALGTVCSSLALLCRITQRFSVELPLCRSQVKYLAPKKSRLLQHQFCTFLVVQTAEGGSSSDQHDSRMHANAYILQPPVKICITQTQSVRQVLSPNALSWRGAAPVCGVSVVVVSGRCYRILSACRAGAGRAATHG